MLGTIGDFCQKSAAGQSGSGSLQMSTIGRAFEPGSGRAGVGKVKLIPCLLVIPDMGDAITSEFSDTTQGVPLVTIDQGPDRSCLRKRHTPGVTWQCIYGSVSESPSMAISMSLVR